MTTFKELNLSQELQQALDQLGFTEATLIQEKSIPAIMEGKDVLGESATGSGKTLAFGAGIVEHVQPGKGIQAVVLTPTRELAEQVKDALLTFAKQKQLRIIPIYGGVAFDPQVHAARTADVLVATPGRLLDHFRQNTLDIAKVKMLILDEADRMLDMGFIEDVEQIMQALPEHRQTLLFSATIAGGIETLAQKYMNKPVVVRATKQVDPKKLTQIYYDVQKNMKLSLLIQLLKKEDASLVMVFCNTRRTTEFVERNLRAQKIHATAIHGGFSQNKRLKTLERFNAGRTEVLVCTDVAARGLHIDNVSHVYNYDLPNDPKEYVHRIGRTARAGEEGKVVNLLCDYDHDNFGRILREFSDFVINCEETPHVERVQIRMEPQQRSRSGFRGGRSPRSSQRRPRQQRPHQRAPYKE